MNTALLSSLLLILAPDAGETDVVRPAPPLEPAELQWDESWDRFRTWEYVATTIALPTALGVRLFGPTPPDNWHGPILFDEAVTDHLVVEEDPARKILVKTTDVLFAGAMIYRAVDDLAVVGAGHGNWDLALQMSMIDLEAFAVVATVLWGSQLFVGRTRPHSTACEEPGVEPGEYGCISSGNSNRYRSFIAGHPATVIAATGVTCLHHSRLPIYGGGLADDMACVSMVGASVATSALRVIAGSHYATDLVFGTALGLLAGWVVPSALHYGFGDEADDEYASLKPATSKPPAVAMTLVPVGPSGTAGLQIVGLVW